MPLNLFTIAERILYAPNAFEKLGLTVDAKALDFKPLTVVRPIADVNFPERPIWLPPRLLPKRNLATAQGRSAFFHAIAHVEFMAIYLAWDLIYRFQEMPQEFYQDWLRVAQEETLHFGLISTYLIQRGTRYGDLPVHGGLWEHAVATADDLTARLALVPRCMEARGLDVTPGLIEKFSGLDDSDAVAVLERLLHDEIGHVERGSYWFNRVCTERELDPLACYQTMLKRYFLGGKPKGPFNRPLRKRAGFSEEELNWLEFSPVFPSPEKQGR